VAPSKRQPGRRVGWSKLSATYRRRLDARGVSRSAWEAGADLRGARGHAPAPPPYAAPPGPTQAAVRGAADDTERRALDTWRSTLAPSWLPSRAWMGTDTAAALASIGFPPSQWRHVTFTPRADGQPWTMTVERTGGGYPASVEIPGGPAAKEVLKMLRDPRSVGVTDDSEWDHWVDEGYDFDVTGSG
jgi:hypothetical protein